MVFLKFRHFVIGSILFFSLNVFGSKYPVSLSYCNNQLSIIAATELGSILTDNERKVVRQYGVPSLDIENRFFSTTFEATGKRYLIEIHLVPAATNCMEADSIFITN